MDFLPRLQEELKIEVKKSEATDSIEGVAPRGVALPADEEATGKLVAWCGANDIAFVIRGGGTKIHIGGRPSRCDLLISTEKLTQIFEHDEGNATIEAGAGITLDDLDEAVGKEGQFVPLDWERGSGATLGGVVATNHYGATKIRYFTPRDLVVGLRASLTDGRAIKAGGKVVKNVSGYDLNKLFIGSYGTLGLITRVTIRLRPNDAMRRDWAASLTSWQQAEAVAQEILNGDFTPALLRVEANGAALRLIARFDGSEAAVQTQLQRLPASITGETAAPPAGALSLRAHLPYSRATTWAQKAQAAGAGSIAWDCGMGVVHAGFASLPDNAITLVDQLRADAEKLDGFMIVLRAPTELKTPAFVWGPLRGEGEIQKTLKKTFDGAGVCGPGRFVA